MRMTKRIATMNTKTLDHVEAKLTARMLVIEALTQCWNNLANGEYDGELRCSSSKCGKRVDVDDAGILVGQGMGVPWFKFQVDRIMDGYESNRELTFTFLPSDDIKPVCRTCQPLVEAALQVKGKKIVGSFDETKGDKDAYTWYGLQATAHRKRRYEGAEERDATRNLLFQIDDRRQVLADNEKRKAEAARRKEREKATQLRLKDFVASLGIESEKPVEEKKPKTKSQKKWENKPRLRVVEVGEVAPAFHSGTPEVA
jgi:hypothetical protein